jgi:hypothetical protein
VAAPGFSAVSSAAQRWCEFSHPSGMIAAGFEPIGCGQRMMEEVLYGYPSAGRGGVRPGARAISTKEHTVSPELGRLLALRRVHRGGITQCGHGAFIDSGRRVPDYIGRYLTTLLADGYIHPGHPQEGTGYLPLLLTGEGQASYADLSASYQRWLRANRSGLSRGDTSAATAGV